MDTAETGMLTVNRLALLKFFDERPDASIGHATGIVSLVGEDLNAACFRHYAEAKCAKVAVLQGPVTTGKQRGPRLDRWIKVDWGCGNEILYQTEIKNWSAHAFGARKKDRLQVKATTQEVDALKQRHWDGQWDSTRQLLKDPSCSKVLTRMNPPSDLKGMTIHPLLIYWQPIGPKQESDDHLFSCPVEKPQSHDFPKVWVFSVSSYLRSLDQEQICLQMPNAVRRMRWLDDMFLRK